MGTEAFNSLEMRVLFVCLLVTLVALAYDKPAAEQTGSDIKPGTTAAEDRGDLSDLIPDIPSLTDIIGSIADQVNPDVLTDAISSAIGNVKDVEDVVAEEETDKKKDKKNKKNKKNKKKGGKNKRKGNKKNEKNDQKNKKNNNKNRKNKQSKRNKQNKNKQAK